MWRPGYAQGVAKFVARWILPALGAAAVVAGLIVVSEAPTSFGWFAYAPLSGATFSSTFISQPLFITGIVLVMLGVADIAGWVGFRLGRRA